MSPARPGPMCTNLIRPPPKEQTNRDCYLDSLCFSPVHDFSARHHFYTKTHPNERSAPTKHDYIQPLLKTPYNSCNAKSPKVVPFDADIIIAPSRRYRTSHRTLESLYSNLFPGKYAQIIGLVPACLPHLRVPTKYYTALLQKISSPFIFHSRIRFAGPLKTLQLTGIY